MVLRQEAKVLEQLDWKLPDLGRQPHRVTHEQKTAPGSSVFYTFYRVQHGFFFCAKLGKPFVFEMFFGVSSRKFQARTFQSSPKSE